MSPPISVVLLGALLPLASAHGYMSGIVAKGSNTGQPRPSRNGLGDSAAIIINDCRDCTLPHDTYDSAHALKSYTTDDVRCAGKNTRNDATNITVSAGETIEVSWDIPIAHPGPAALYMSFDGDQTWVLLAQVIDPFIGLIPGEPNIWDGDKKENGYEPNWKITMPQNLAASQKATLRGEWLNTQAPEMYVTCVDIITEGPGAAPTDGFEITGTPGGPSHLLGIQAGTPYPAYQAGTNYVTNGIGYENFINLWRTKLQGPAIYDFGSGDYAVNVEMTVTDKDGATKNFPDDLKIGDMNPSVPATQPAPEEPAPEEPAPEAEPSNAPQPASTQTADVPEEEKDSPQEEPASECVATRRRRSLKTRRQS